MSDMTYTNAIAVTTSDTVKIPATAALYVGGAGNVKVTMAGAGATIVTFLAVPAGTTLPVAVTQVFATLTTATDIVALR